MERKVLKASKGMVLTNGNIYGKTIYLSDNADKNAFYEITQGKYDEIISSDNNNLEICLSERSIVSEN